MLAIAYFFSSEIDKKILNFLTLKNVLILLVTFLFTAIRGLPLTFFITSISLKLILYLKPVPNAFTKASFAANLFE